MNDTYQIFKIVEGEIDDYRNKSIDLSEGVSFSQYKLVRRISLFQNQIYPQGKIDSQNDYKYWNDIITPRINSEIKNIDFDTKDITIYSDSVQDRLGIYLADLSLKAWLKSTGQAEELNDAVEQYSALGNIVWKKIKGGYERVDLSNFYVVNQTARTLDESAAIERHMLTQSDLRKMEGTFKNIEEVIEGCGNKEFGATVKATKTTTSNPYYEIYERNGEVSEEVLFESMGKAGGDKKKYVEAKIIMSGLGTGKNGKRYILFAEKLTKSPYKEAHRGLYTGRWFRKGMVEILFDPQTRANTIGNQLAKGLEWASKTIFRSADDSIVNNLLTDMRTGDIIRTKDLSQVDVRMQGLDQLIVDWNRNLALADMLSNSFEVVQGQTMPSNTPFKLGNLLDQNANKLFDFLREKLSIGLTDLVDEWVMPMLLKDLGAQKVIDLTNSEENLKDFYMMVTDAWYIKNLIKLPPHSPEMAQTIKESKLEQLMTDNKAQLKTSKEFWKGLQLRAKVVIDGENVRLTSELESILSFTQMESDPVRRSAMIEMAMAKKNIDLSSLPKSTPEQLLGLTQPGNQDNPNNANAEAQAAPIQ